MTVEQALNVIANALAEYRGSFHEHQVIQKAFEFIVNLIKEHEKKQDNLDKIQNFDNK